MWHSEIFVNLLQQKVKTPNFDRKNNRRNRLSQGLCKMF